MDSENRWFNTGSAETPNDRRENERDQYACNPDIEKRKLPLLIHNLRFQTIHDRVNTLVSELLPLGCLSVLRQEENSWFP